MCDPGATASSQMCHITAGHFIQSHSLRVTIPLDRGLHPVAKECSLTCHLFSLQFWEMVLGKLFTGKRYAFVFILLRKKCIEVHFIGVTLCYYRQSSATPLIWRLFGSYCKGLWVSPSLCARSVSVLAEEGYSFGKYCPEQSCFTLYFEHPFHRFYLFCFVNFVFSSTVQVKKKFKFWCFAFACFSSNSRSGITPIYLLQLF